VSLFASHEFTRYQRSEFRQTQIFQVGFNASHQLTKYLFLETSYTTFVNKVNPIYRGESIQRLRALTFQYRRRRFEVSTSGGIQYAKHSGSRHIVADAEAAIWVGSQSTGFSLGYNHGLTSIIGAGSAVETDTVNLSLRHRVSNRFFVGLNSYYMRHSTPATPYKSEFESLAASAGVQLALTTGLVFSINHNYISQQARNVAFDAPRLSRYASLASINYILPAWRVR